jgi:MYXO-CTERM domain-containing protein
VAVEDEGQGLDVQNLLLLGSTLPIEASTALGNLAVSELAFVDAAAHDYHLAEGSPALDLGLDLPLVTTDFDGEARPQGVGTDIGADERAAEDSGDTDDTDVTEGDDTGLDSAEPAAPGLSAAMRAGEVGGCHCATGGVSGLPLGALLGGLALLRRRRRLT